MLTWEAHAGAVTSLAFVPGGGLLSTGTDGVLKHWDATSGTEYRAWALAEKVAVPRESDLRCVLVDATGRYAAVGLRHEGARFFHLTDGSVAGEFRLDSLNDMARTPFGATLFCIGDRAGFRMRVWQVTVPMGQVLAKSARPCPARFGGSGSNGEMAVSPDGTRVIAGRQRFDWPSGEIAGPPALARGCMYAVSPDGDKLFAVQGRYVTVWGFQVGAFRRKLKGHLAPITGLTATPDGRKLWTCSFDATVRQWDVETYRCEKCYGLKVGPLGCVAVSPDGLTAAAGSAHNGRIAVWDLE
jgi:WD40 repeat protein